MRKTNVLLRPEGMVLIDPLRRSQVHLQTLRPASASLSVGELAVVKRIRTASMNVSSRSIELSGVEKTMSKRIDLTDANSPMDKPTEHVAMRLKGAEEARR